MIQRIQTLYLLIAIVMLILASFFPLYTFNNGQVVMNGFYVSSVQGTKILSTITLNIINWLAALISFISIFLYKHRILQMRLITYTIIILLGFYFMLIYYRFSVLPKIEQITYSKLEIFALFPVISAILLYMAAKAIKKDEEKIRSMDRFRD